MDPLFIYILFVVASLAVLYYVSHRTTSIQVLSSGINAANDGRNNVPIQDIKQQYKDVMKDEEEDGHGKDEMTYAKTPINKLDDYEYSRIFKVEKESRNELERTTINSLTAQRQFDWSQLPFNSSSRADKEQPYNGKRMESVNSQEGFTNPVTEPFFTAINGENMVPQDYEGMDEREKAILQQYSPKKTEDLMEQSTDDVQTLVDKLYATDPDWAPVLEKINGNQFQVTGLVAKTKKEDIMYEDEKVPTIAEAIGDGLTSIKDSITGNVASNEAKIVPSNTVVKKQDPYFDKDGVLDYEGDRFYRYDQFAKWDKNLERMFAPTFDKNDWVGIGLDD